MNQTPDNLRRPESVLVVVYTTGGDVLLMERRDRPGFWQSVTGSLQPGETPAQAARRELCEETGLRGEPLDRRQCRDFEIFPEYRHRFEPGVTRNAEHAFAWELPEQVPVCLDPAEHRRFGWYGWREAVEMTPSWTNREAIAELFEEAAP